MSGNRFVTQCVRLGFTLAISSVLMPSMQATLCLLCWYFL